MADEWPGEHVYRINNTEHVLAAVPADLGSLTNLRATIEPWITALLGSEHLSLLVGSGLTLAVTSILGAPAVDMSLVGFTAEYADKVDARAAIGAESAGRGSPNIEDQMRAALELVGGLRVIGDAALDDWETQIGAHLRAFATKVLAAEQALIDAEGTDKGITALNVLSSFLGSFTSRAATRDRLHIFTTNYDRMIEFGLDHSGTWKLDRFLGSVAPTFRASRLDVDLHYSPPGIRGEPRYLEGVVRVTKLHGSVDWLADRGRVRRVPVAFGCPAEMYESLVAGGSSLLIYPNPAKDVETSEYPYAELFRDFASAVVRPNSVLVTYGYGFGDDHINRVIADMLTVPSTHLLALVYADPDQRLRSFINASGRQSQVSVLLGPHLGDLENLTHFYLPKPSIDRITIREADLLKRRGFLPTVDDDEDADLDPATDGEDD